MMVTHVISLSTNDREIQLIVLAKLMHTDGFDLKGRVILWFRGLVCLYQSQIQTLWFVNNAYAS